MIFPVQGGHFFKIIVLNGSLGKTQYYEMRVEIPN